MIYKSDEEIKSLIRAFEECTLPRADWTHAAHLTVGLYYCLHYPFETVKNLMRNGIPRLNDAHGTPNTETSGYHETLTIFWLLTIKEFIANSGGGNPAELANSLIAGCDSDLPFKFYSRPRLFSREARARYIEPDLRENILKRVD